jgi:hypothetical protein
VKTIAGVLAAAVTLLGMTGLSSAASTPSGVPKNPNFASPVYGRAATLSGPITVGQVIEPESGATTGSTASYGYTEHEFFASGTADAFRTTSAPSDGRWKIAPDTSAAYKTRILVRLPTDPKRFNGTVVVEWLNVSSGESSPDWDYLNPMLTRDGFGYVGVSAQSLGVDGGTGITSTTGSSLGLVHQEPSRYGSLNHPGDQYALDIFAQVGRALRLDKSSDVFSGLHPKHIVAAGESQSAFYLTTFADAIQPLTQTFDGIFIHSRGGTGAPLSGASITGAPVGPADLRIRTDLTVPVFMFETETDMTKRGYAPAQQPDTSGIRTWEVAGTSHADSYIVGSYASVLGCKTEINMGPQHPVVQAAFTAFSKWVTEGTPPPSPRPMVVASTNPVTLAKDPEGNVKGGVRTPDVDVPSSVLSGVAPPGASVLCSLFGSTTPFTSSQMAQLYGDKATYLHRYDKSLDRAISDGYILPQDRAGLMAQAEQVQFPA